MREDIMIIFQKLWANDRKYYIFPWLRLDWAWSKAAGLKAESRHFGMISASWTDKHISVLYVYFLVIIAILGISTPLHHKEKFSLISI